MEVTIDPYNGNVVYALIECVVCGTTCIFLSSSLKRRVVIIAFLFDVVFLIGDC